MYFIYKNPILQCAYVVTDMGHDPSGDGSTTYVKIIQIVASGVGYPRPLGDEFQVVAKYLYANPNELIKSIL